MVTSHASGVHDRGASHERKKSVQPPKQEECVTSQKDEECVTSQNSLCAGRYLLGEGEGGGMWTLM